MQGFWSFFARGDSPAGSRPPHAEQKASKAGPLIAYDTLGQPVWSPRDYGAFAREGFMQNAIVYRSVRMIAEAAASIPLLLYAGSEEIETHPLLDLMRKPSADHTGPDFLEAWFGFLLVSGNAYVEAVAVDGQIRELHNLRPDRMKVLPGLDGWPEGYEYTAGGKSVRFTSEPVEGVRPVLHTRLFHPVNDHYGMSPIEAAATAIDIHNTASGWNKALLDNSARPSGALVYAASNGQMTDEQFARLKSELETNYQGAAHAGRPLLLEGGLDWKPLSLSPKDMDFIEAKNAAAREIALAIGVPPMLLGIPGDNTFANYAEAQRALWRNTVLPLVNRMCAAFSAWLSPAFALGDSPSSSRPPSAGVLLEFRPDLDQVEALNPEREALWARLQNVTFLTDDEKRAAAGYAALFDAPSDTAPRSRPEGAGALRAKYRDDQPRVRAGNADGGQWTSDGGGSGDRLAMSKLPRALELLKPMLKPLPKVLKPSEKPLHELIKPGGKELGSKFRSSGDGVRTVERDTFSKLKNELMDGAKEVAGPRSYEGKVFRRPDNSEFGVRYSEKYGETIDVMKTTDRIAVPDGYKLHA